MRALLQRVERARVCVAGQVSGEIGAGLLVLLGVGSGDDAAQARNLARKIAKLRIFADDADRMNRSLLDVQGAVLAVSQFTLYADARSGNRPSYTGAARPEIALPLFEEFVIALREQHVSVETGVFGAQMKVELTNDGPVTIWLDSHDL